MTNEQRARVARLVTALRSGKYRQTREVLSRRGAYCCLGVACEVYRQETGDGAWQTVEWEGATARQFVVGRKSDVEQMPLRVARWFGFGRTLTSARGDRLSQLGDPYLIATDPHDPDRASALNDDRKWRFKRIADAFERSYLSRAHPSGTGDTA